MRVCLSTLLLAVPLAAADKAPVDFTREIRPILANSCLACHGPDEKARKAKLRLDVKAGARGVLSPGNPDDSDHQPRRNAAASANVHHGLEPPGSV